MKSYFSQFLRYLALFLMPLTLQVSPAAAATPRQLSTRLSGHVPNKAVADATFLDNLNSSSEVPLTFILPLRNQEVLKELVQRIRDPNDKEYYGKYLSSREFIKRFAPTRSDYNKVIAYAKKMGFTITNLHPNRLLLNVVGKARTVESAFNLNLHQYETTEGRRFYAPNNEPQVPVTIAAAIGGIVGLDNYTVWQSRYTKGIATESNVLPSTIVPTSNLTGIFADESNEAIALFELGGYESSDINTYADQFGIADTKLTHVLVDGGSNAGIDQQATLDIELTLVLAPYRQIYVYEGPNSTQGILNTYNRIVTDNIAKQISTSWELCEDLETVPYAKAKNAIFLQMAAHGQTIYAPAKDSDLATNRNVPDSAFNADTGTGYAIFFDGQWTVYGGTSSTTIQSSAASPLLNVSITHDSPFVKGKMGTYKIEVSNEGDGSTSGAVSVAVDLPVGLAYASYIGSGWTVDTDTLTFTQDSSLDAGSTYPHIILKVAVSSDAPHSVTPIATVSGGGSVSSTASNFTTTK